MEREYIKMRFKDFIPLVLAKMSDYDLVVNYSYLLNEDDWGTIPRAAGRLRKELFYDLYEAYYKELLSYEKL